MHLRSERAVVDQTSDLKSEPLALLYQANHGSGAVQDCTFERDLLSGDCFDLGSIASRERAGGSIAWTPRVE